MFNQSLSLFKKKSVAHSLQDIIVYPVFLVFTDPSVRMEQCFPLQIKKIGIQKTPHLPKQRSRFKA